MFEKRSLGFTLIELLAVIVVLAIIMVIATPIVVKTIDDAKKGSFKNSVNGIIKAAEYDRSRKIVRGEKPSKIIYTYTDGIETSNPSGNKLDLRGTKPQNGIVIIDTNGNVAMAIHDGTYCATRSLIDTEVTISDKILKDCFIPFPPSSPELSEGMIPIKWDGSKWIKADINSTWYNYDNKEWANVVLVTENARDSYKNALFGTEILEADVLAYLVWIPRYRYKLFNVESAKISPQTIEIVFEDESIPKSEGNTNGEWLTHPAFTFGTDELNGIWVGKFETTGNVTTPTVKPGITSLRSQNVSTQFITSQLFNDSITYGITSNFDAHMMKNMEWGAVAYLSHSVYGKNSEISINSNSGYYTGGGVANAYVMNAAQSTTGNIYGIYDMSGGAWEYVMGVMYNSDNATIMVGESCFNQTIIDALEMLKYINKYVYGTSSSDYIRRQLGDATGETRGWYNDSETIVNSINPWFRRGGYYSSGSMAGAFYSSSTTGGIAVYLGYRLSIAP